MSFDALEDMKKRAEIAHIKEKAAFLRAERKKLETEIDRDKKDFIQELLDHQIVQQPNGRYALWHREENAFSFINHASAEDIRDRILGKIEGILADMVNTAHIRGETGFEMCLNEYKEAHGLITTLPPDPAEKASATLAEMGVSVEDY